MPTRFNHTGCGKNFRNTRKPITHFAFHPTVFHNVIDHRQERFPRINTGFIPSSLGNVQDCLPVFGRRCQFMSNFMINTGLGNEHVVGNWRFFSKWVRICRNTSAHIRCKSSTFHESHRTGIPADNRGKFCPVRRKRRIIQRINHRVTR